MCNGNEGRKAELICCCLSARAKPHRQTDRRARDEHPQEDAGLTWLQSSAWLWSSVANGQSRCTSGVGAVGSPYRGGLLDLGLYLLHNSLGLGSQHVSKPAASRKWARNMVVCCDQDSSLSSLLVCHCTATSSVPSHQAVKRAGARWQRAFFATALSFFGAVFLVTPVGLAPAFLVVVAGFARGLRAIAGDVSTVWNTRGFELPVADRVPSRAIVSGAEWIETWARRVSRGAF